MKFRPAGEALLVRLDPLINEGPIFLVHGPRVRTGEVLSIGPGRWTKRGRRVPLDVAVGERIAFFREHLEHRQGKDILHALTYVGEDLGLLRAPDILFVLPPDWKGELS